MEQKFNLLQEKEIHITRINVIEKLIRESKGMEEIRDNVKFLREKILEINFEMVDSKSIWRLLRTIGYKSKYLQGCREYYHNKFYMAYYFETQDEQTESILERNLLVSLLPMIEIEFTFEEPRGVILD